MKASIFWENGLNLGENTINNLSFKVLHIINNCNM